MSSEEMKNPPDEGGLSQKNMDGKHSDIRLDDIIQSSPEIIKKQSKVSKLIALSLHDHSPDVGGNYWLTCPWCGEDKLNFHVKKWLWYCYACDRGRGMNLSDLMRYLRIE